MHTTLRQIFPNFTFEDAEIYKGLDEAVQAHRFKYSDVMARTIFIDGVDAEGDEFRIYVIGHWSKELKLPNFKAVIVRPGDKFRGGSIESELRHIHLEPNDPNFHVYPLRTQRFPSIQQALFRLAIDLN